MFNLANAHDHLWIYMSEFECKSLHSFHLLFFRAQQSQQIKTITQIQGLPQVSLSTVSNLFAMQTLHGHSLLKKIQTGISFTSCL